MRCIFFLGSKLFRIAKDFIEASILQICVSCVFLVPIQLTAQMSLSIPNDSEHRSFRTNDEANNIDVFKRTSPSVVNITNSRLIRSYYSLNPQEVPQGSGTGFIWSDDGHIVTNFHVVQQASRVTVTLQDGSTFDATPIGIDPDKD